MTDAPIAPAIAQFFSDPWTAFETENMLVTMLLQDAAYIGPTLDVLIGAAFHDPPASLSFSLRSQAQFRLLSALHRVFKIIRHDPAGPVRHVVPPAVAFDSMGSYLPSKEQASTLSEQLDQIEANVEPLRRHWDERAEVWIQIMVGAASSNQLADDAVWAAFVAVLKDWIRFSLPRRTDEGGQAYTLEVILVSLPSATQAALDSDSAPLTRKLISLIRTVIGSTRPPSASIRKTVGSSLAALSPLPRASSPTDSDDPCEIIIHHASADPDCRAALLIAHLELLSTHPGSSADASCPTCAFAGDNLPEPRATASTLNLMSVNDKHLVHFLLAHLALFQNLQPEALATCILPIVTVSPAGLFCCFANVVVAHDPLTMIDFLLDSADWIAYLSSFARWAASAVSATSKLDASAVRLLIDVEKQLGKGSFPFNARPLAAAIQQCVAIHG